MNLVFESAEFWELLGITPIIMLNIYYTLNLEKNELLITYAPLYTQVEHGFRIEGSLCLDSRTFFVSSKAIDNSDELSQTEKDGIIKYIMRDSKMHKNIEVIFK